MAKKLSADELAMVDDVYAAMMLEAPRAHQLIIWSITLMLITFLWWAHLSELDQITSGEGKVIPSSQVQLIQSLDGGTLQALYVSEGAVVKQGQALARIDDTRFRSDFAQQSQETDSLTANVIRLQTELDSLVIRPANRPWQQQLKINKQRLKFPANLIETQPELVARQRAEYQTRLDGLSNQLAILAQQIQQKQQETTELDAKIDSLNQSFALIQKEYRLTQPLAAKGIVPEVELIKLARSVNDIEGELQSLRLMHPKIKAAQEEVIFKRREALLKFSADSRAQLNELQTRLSRINEAQVGAADKLSKTVITSPVDGIVKTMHINTLGGVVKPAVDLIEIVPTEDQLLIETRILPKDIAFLAPGLPAVVKVSAYDFTRYGGLKGTVEHISADTTLDEQGNSFYLIRVRTAQSSLTKADGTPMPIIPGMLTSVDIITGKRSILDYILNPILRAKDTALRER